MKKLFIKLLVICLLVPFIGTFKVSAQDLKSCGYEVAYINDDGSFSTESCYSDFASAKNRMKELGGDVVVRHDSSYSYTKIIAMNSFQESLHSTYFKSDSSMLSAIDNNLSLSSSLVIVFVLYIFY